jgi:hypothetical protein
MANKVTQDNIIEFNELYLIYKTYAAVARQTGFSPTTVKKYILPGYTSKNSIEKKVFLKADLPECVDSPFVGIANWGDLCVLSETEREEIVSLWEELLV